MKTPSKILLVISASCLITACQQQPRTMAMCEQTVRDYADHRDNPAAVEKYGNLFTDNGTFSLGGETVTGKAALIERHKTANDAAMWNHVMDKISVQPDLTGKSRVVVYTTPKNGNEKNVTRFIVADYIDRFEVIASGCKIADRQVNIIFDSAAKRTRKRPVK